MDEERLTIGTRVSWVIKYKISSKEEILWWRNVLFFVRKLLVYFMTNFTFPQ